MTLLRSALSLLTAAVLVSGASAQGWGTSIKGKVVLVGVPPARKVITPDNDAAFCQKNGKILADDLVVDQQTNGVRWCVAYLIAEDGDFKTKLPVNPAIK